MSSLWTAEIRYGTRRMGALGGHPFLIVIDGLDECEDKEEIQDLVEGMLAFFDDNPFIPLRVFITSRVEQHIQSHLNVPGVRLTNLVNHCSDDDIATFLDVLFESEKRGNPVIRAYISEHGEWPIPSDKKKLVKHIGGSFIFASSVYKFIMGSTAQVGSPTTPMDRLPLALQINPGLDGLYAQILARSEHLPHFLNIISTIALLKAPLPTSGIAELLGIGTYEVVHVLVNIEAIIQVPGTDDIPVTLFHTSLRDFLTIQSRSGRFFAHPRHHVHLFLRSRECELEIRRRRPGVPVHPSECTPAVAYSLEHSITHLYAATHLFERSESDSAIHLCREALALHPGSPELVHALADVICNRARKAMADGEEAISLYREALALRPRSHTNRSSSLNNLGIALRDRYERTQNMTDLEESISLHREALALRPWPHPNRSSSLNNLGIALRDRWEQTQTIADLKETISLHREALALQPWPHSDRWLSLINLSKELVDHSTHTGAGTVADIEEAIPLCREALELQPSPCPDRTLSLNNLGSALLNRYLRTRTMADLEEGISLYRESLDLCPSPNLDRTSSLQNLGNALVQRYQRTGIMAGLDEAILLH